MRPHVLDRRFWSTHPLPPSGVTATETLSASDYFSEAKLASQMTRRGPVINDAAPSSPPQSGP